MKTYGSRFPSLCWFMLPVFLLLAAPAYAQNGEGELSAASSADSQVMHAFTQQELQGGDALEVPERQRHLILFSMGAALLIFLIVTAALGVAMAIYGKRVFIAHMIFAGFSVTLAIVHSVVAVVWFFPFSSP